MRQGGEPLAHERSFAKSGRGGDQGEFTLEASIELIEQTWAWHVTHWDGRGKDFGG